MVEKDKDQYDIDIVAALSKQTINRLWIALLLTIVLLFGSNAWWVWRDSQYVDESWTYEATTDSGGDAIANGDGEVNVYGESESDAQETNP